MLILRLLLSFMKIGSLSFGGAYAAIPLVEKEIVETRQWMSYDDFANLLAFDELTPGPILINSATFVGMKMAGVSGAAAATLGCILPPCLISFVLLMVYRKYKKLSFMRNFLEAFKCMAIALIFSTFLRITGRIFEFGNVKRDLPGCVLIVFSFLVLRKYKINPLYIMLGCGILYFICGLIL